MKSKFNIIMIGLGSTLIFFSWVSQNYYENKWRNNFALQERIRENILVETCMNDIFLIEYYRLWSTKPINYASLARIALRTSLSASYIMAMSDSLATLSTKETGPFMYRHEQTEEKLYFLYSSERYEELILEADKIITKYDKEWEPKQEMSANFTFAYLEANKWNGIYLVLYIIGSILISTGWLLSKIHSLADKKDLNDRIQRCTTKSDKKKKHK